MAAALGNPVARRALHPQRDPVRQVNPHLQGDRPQHPEEARPGEAHRGLEFLPGEVHQGGEFHPDAEGPVGTIGTTGERTPGKITADIERLLAQSVLGCILPPGRRPQPRSL